MRAAALALLAALIAAPASFAYSHCYSIWKNPWPQHCGVKSPPHNWYVELVTPPPPVRDERTPQDIADQAEHDAAVTANHDELNTRLKLLQAQKGNLGAWK